MTLDIRIVRPSESRPSKSFNDLVEFGHGPINEGLVCFLPSIKEFFSDLVFQFPQEEKGIIS
jgi:hypothetical protein